MTRFSFLVMAGLAVAACGDNRAPEAVALELAKPAISALTGRADPEIATPFFGIDDQGFVNLCARTDSMDGPIEVEVSFTGPAKAWLPIEGGIVDRLDNGLRCGKVQRWRWIKWTVDQPAKVRSALVDGTMLPGINTAAEKVEFAASEKDLAEVLK